LFGLLMEMEAALGPYLDVPFAFLGYSLGALMAFETARELRRRRKLEPTNLIVAAHRAPQLPRRHPAISSEPKFSFVRELETRYGPFEPAIKADPEMLDLIVDIMRVDLSMLESYHYQDEEPFRCPIAAVGGSEDASMIPSELAGWRMQTTGPFSEHWLRGGHFFLRNRGSELRSLVRDAISQAASPPSPRV
jgi:medium-chain acyl-[acyl-carrier-protein] hydrolase